MFVCADARHDDADGSATQAAPVALLLLRLRALLLRCVTTSLLMTSHGQLESIFRSREADQGRARAKRDPLTTTTCSPTAGGRPAHEIRAGW